MIDFSCKHDILIRNPDGSVQPMDEPFFEARPVLPPCSAGLVESPAISGARQKYMSRQGPATWQILSDGDYSYLVIGGENAISIDTGYGSGDIRAFEQTLTDVPVRYAANTHDHFDHTAGNSYFDAVYMSAETEPLATVPYPSFAGIDFPKAKEVRIVRDGDVIDLGDRMLEALFLPDHAAGSLLFLDRRERILFAGDEVSDFKRINGTVANVLAQLQRLAGLRDAYDIVCAGPGIFPAEVVDELTECAAYILSSGDSLPGEPVKAGVYHAPSVPGYEESVIYVRRAARPEDLPPGFDRPDPCKRVVKHGCVQIQYDIRRIR